MLKKLLVNLVLFLILSLSANADLVINEIMYNPSGADGSHEWIEIYNTGNEIDLEDYVFFEANTNHRMDLAQGDDEVISENEYIVIADNAQAFLQDYQNFGRTVFDSSFSLSNSGEYLALKDSDGNIVDEVNYSSDWGDIEGNSLELINPALDNNDGMNWNSSSMESGTPGEVNSIFTPIFREALYHHQIYLKYGWNLISSYVAPYDTNLNRIFWFPIETNYLELVKDSHGRFFNPRTGFDNIQEWNPYEAYWVKVNWDVYMLIEGDEVIDSQIPLDPGWNFIAYPLNETHSADEVIEDVFDSLGDNLIMVKDQDGRFYSRRHNYNNIREFTPGRGYQVKVNEEAVLDFSSL